MKLLTLVLLALASLSRAQIPLTLGPDPQENARTLQTMQANQAYFVSAGPIAKTTVSRKPNLTVIFQGRNEASGPSGITFQECPNLTLVSPALSAPDVASVAGLSDSLTALVLVTGCPSTRIIGGRIGNAPFGGISLHNSPGSYVEGVSVDRTRVRGLMIDRSDGTTVRGFHVGEQWDGSLYSTHTYDVKASKGVELYRLSAGAIRNTFLQATDSDVQAWDLRADWVGWNALKSDLSRLRAYGVRIGMLGGYAAFTGSNALAGCEYQNFKIDKADPRVCPNPGSAPGYSFTGIFYTQPGAPSISYRGIEATLSAGMYLISRLPAGSTLLDYSQTGGRGEFDPKTADAFKDTAVN